MDSGFITGFVDGEGCFSVNISKDKKRNTGFQITQSFRINLHRKDSAVLVLIQKKLKVGKIYKTGTAVNIKVSSIEELEIIIAFFDQYPLITKKSADFLLFKEVFILIKNKEHLTKKGLEKIVAIRATLNLGLSEKLKVAFPNIVPVERPLVLNQKIPNPN
jgi:hypothetical protein